MELLIQPDGGIRCIYDDSLPLAALGALSFQRASHVEPDTAGQWHADLQPVGGPILGPFVIRSEALAAEVAWLTRHWLQREFSNNPEP